MQEKRLKDDSRAAERTCANEVCGCSLTDASASDFCSEYCSGEGDRGDGVCQCGHVGCA